MPSFAAILVNISRRFLVQWYPDFLKLQGKRKLVREIGGKIAVFESKGNDFLGGLESGRLEKMGFHCSFFCLFHQHPSRPIHLNLSEGEIWSWCIMVLRRLHHAMSARSTLAFFAVVNHLCEPLRKHKSRFFFWKNLKIGFLI